MIVKLQAPASLLWPGAGYVSRSGSLAARWVGAGGAGMGGAGSPVWRRALGTFAIAMEGIAMAQSCTGSDSCSPHGVCIAGACACVHGYSGTACSTPPDPCAWPVAVRCGSGATCVEGLCVRVDPCNDPTPCGQHGECVEGHCECADGWAGAGCSDVDECASQPCRNGGSCFHSADVQALEGPAHAQLADAWAGRHVCACASGYAGAECQCLHCGEHGTCQFDGRCACEPGFVGAQCEINVDECASKPCMNGAICNDQDLAYSCSCSSGFSGENCEHDIDECGSSPCEPHGKCTDSVSSYICSCEDGWSGENCSEAPACISSPCQNGADCIDYASPSGEFTYRCKCKAGWLGDQCMYHACEASPPACAHGGKCRQVETEEDARGFACECVDGYRGAACVESPDLCEWPTPLDCGAYGSCEVRPKVRDGRACKCIGGYTGPTCAVPPDPCFYPTQKDCGEHGAFFCTLFPLWLFPLRLPPRLLVLA